MIDDDRVITIIEAHPFGKDLDELCTSLHQIINSPDELSCEALQKLSRLLVPPLQNHPVSCLLPSRIISQGATLQDDLLRLPDFSISTGGFNFNLLRPLLLAILRGAPDVEIWEGAYLIVNPPTVTTVGIMDRDQVATIEAYPFGTAFDELRTFFNRMVSGPAELRIISYDALPKLWRKLFFFFQPHTLSELLPSGIRLGTLQYDITMVELLSIDASRFDFNRIRPLLAAVLTKASDVDIWKEVYLVVVPHTPRQKFVSIQQTPKRYTTSLVNSSESRSQMDGVLRDELGVMYIDVPNFYQVFFGDIAGLKTAAEDIFHHKCRQGPQPLFENGWTAWPEDAREGNVLAWLGDIVRRLSQWAAQERKPTTRKLLMRPNTSLAGSAVSQKLDVGFVQTPGVDNEAMTHTWPNILIPGELESDPRSDIASEAHLDIARYVRKVFIAQPTRRFVLAFTLCGSWMRLWEFDRLGAIASEQFNINEDGQRFVSTILAFLWMDDEALGFDPTIIKSDHQQYIEIQQDMKTKRLILDKPIISGRGIVGRATTCWKAYLEGDESRPLVVKDSWQLLEREEGKLLQEATALGVTNVVRYYHHETVRIRAKDDDVQANIRKGLDITKASNYRIDCAQSLAVEAGIFVEIGKAVEAVEAVSRGNSSLKRPSDQTDVLVPPSKRSRLGSASHMPHPNRIHRRVILCDYGKPIYRASSRVAFLGALEGCIQGHESLYKAGFLHRDISINNLMVNESDKNSLSSFLIDLDLAVMVNQTQPPGAKEMTGTKAFISIGILNGSTGHSFMDDLESFFWVFFWICIHYDEWGRDRVVTEYDNWNFAKPKFLATIKRGVINTEQDFLQTVTEDFTEHYRVLVPWVNELRKVVFPDGRRWEYEDPSLYSRMREILRKAQSDPRV